MQQVNWPEAIKPLLKKYKDTKHPLNYENIYQLLVMVVLSARDKDVRINELAPAFFEEFPNMQSLNAATPEAIANHLKSVRSGLMKTNWLKAIAADIKTDSAIPLQHEALTKLKGIGTKSANVILREAGKPAEGVIVDIHVVRVAPLLGIVSSNKPEEMEEEIKSILPKKQWDAGMCMSFLGREICRPKPLCEICLMTKVCNYFHEVVIPSKISNNKSH